MNLEERNFWQQLEVLDKQHWMSNSLVGEGNLRFEGNLRISGSWKGELMGVGEKSCLHLLQSSQIEGKLSAHKIQLEGTCTNCTIQADVLLIKAGAKIQGNIHAKTLSIEEGAVVEAGFGKAAKL